MSLSNLLNPETKNETWSSLYCDSLSTNNLSVDELHVNQLSIGDPPYTLPISRPSSNSQLLLGNANGTTSFKTIFRFNLVFGGTMNASPRYMISSGVPNQAAATTDGNLSQARIPYACQIDKMTVRFASGNQTTQFSMNKNGILFAVFTFQSNGTTGLLPTMSFAAGDTISIFWDGVGTQPGDSQIFVFFTEL